MDEVLVFRDVGKKNDNVFFQNLKEEQDYFVIDNR